MLTTTTLQRRDNTIIPISNSIPNNTNNNTNTNTIIKTPIEIDGKTFTSKQEIKPWLQLKLSNNGINIVIARSDDSKIVFKCKCKFKSNKKNLKKSSNNNSSISKPTKKQPIIPCPFRIRANYSIRLKLWTIVVVNDTHNHHLHHNNININEVPNIDSNINLNKMIMPPSPPPSPPTNDSISQRSSIYHILNPVEKKLNTTATPKSNNNNNLPKSSSSSSSSPNDISITNTSTAPLLKRIETSIIKFQNEKSISDSSKTQILSNVLSMLDTSLPKKSLTNALDH